MHRSYNSYNPVASKLLQKRWDDNRFDKHRDMVGKNLELGNKILLI